MIEKALVVEVSDDLVTLTLNRPQRLNALNDEMLELLAATLMNVPGGTRTVVIRGAGRAFSSGHDLKHAAEQGRMTAVEARSVVESMQRVAEAMRQCPVPIVTQVHGYAIGGGAEIALSGDVVIAAEDCVFQFTEASVGRVVTNGFTNLLPKTVGPVLAKKFLVLGAPFSGVEAERYGLLTEVCEAQDLEFAVTKAVESIRSQSAWAVSAAKRLLNTGLQSTFENSIELEVGSAIEAELGPDAEAGARAFTTK